MVTDDRGRSVDFDPEAALAAARSAVDSRNILTCVAYDTETFETVYVDDRVDEMYADVGAREEHFGRIHSYVHLDFTERQLFEELFVEPDGVRAFVTYMGSTIAARVVANSQGIFFSLSPETAVTQLVEAVEPTLR